MCLQVLLMDGNYLPRRAGNQAGGFTGTRKRSSEKSHRCWRLHGCPGSGECPLAAYRPHFHVIITKRWPWKQRRAEPTIWVQCTGSGVIRRNQGRDSGCLGQKGDLTGVGVPHVHSGGGAPMAPVSGFGNVRCASRANGHPCYILWQQCSLYKCPWRKQKPSPEFAFAFIDSVPRSVAARWCGSQVHFRSCDLKLNAESSWSRERRVGFATWLRCMSLDGKGWGGWRHKVLLSKQRGPW